jgi:hypothetical protein
VLGVPDRAVIVDWLDAASGDPAADVCRSYILMRHRDQAFAEAYAQLYAKVTESDPKAILRWLPYVAAARLSEDVPDEVEDLLRMVAVDPRG